MIPWQVFALEPAAPVRHGYGFGAQKTVGPHTRTNRPSVGKIFKPELRCDASARLVRGVLLKQHRLPDAQVRVSAGGPRG